MTSPTNPTNDLTNGPDALLFTDFAALTTTEFVDMILDLRGQLAASKGECRKLGRWLDEDGKKLTTARKALDSARVVAGDIQRASEEIRKLAKDAL